MSWQILFGAFVVPAVAFGFAYYPLVTHLSLAIASPYPKADLRKRFLAGAIDGLVCVTGWAFWWTMGSGAALMCAALYALLRDAIQGQSMGKFLLGLVVIDLETGRPSTLGGSVKRNLLWLMPGVNLVSIFLETATVVRDAQGQRLGDRWAQTHVIEGLGARDLAASIRQGFNRLIDELERAARRPGRGAVPVDR